MNEARFKIHVVERTGVVYAGTVDKLDDALYVARGLIKRGRCIIEDTHTRVHHAVGADGTLVPTEIPLQGIVDTAEQKLEKLGITPQKAAEAVGFGLIRAGIAWGVFRLIVGPPKKRLKRESLVASVAGLGGITLLALGYHRLGRTDTATTDTATTTA